MEFASTLPIEAMGFILVPNRRRTVSLEKLATLLQSVPSSIERVGVFQNPTIEEVQRAVSLGLSMVQLHGQESPEFCNRVKEICQIPIIKVFSETKIQDIPFYKDQIDIVLLDHAAGGMGEPIDWSYIPQAKQVTETYRFPLWIAGGLNDSNIEDLCCHYKIDGVDLSSGIEKDGKKDKHKMINIIERMQKYDGKDER